MHESKVSEIQKVLYSIREKSFFENFNTSIVDILRVIVKYATKSPRYSIIEGSDISKQTISKIINKLVSMMKPPDYLTNKLGGPGLIVQIDEKMLNYKCKSHRGRSPTNRTDAICIVEKNQHILRVFAQIIPDKRAATLIPIICRQVANNSIIWTDEHKSYSKLSELDFFHSLVCHKY
jgi:hypothetical protein